MKPSIWTTERVERVAQLWKEGRSALEIANAIGVPSRSAVLGKLNRLGLLGKRITAPRPPKKRTPSYGYAPKRRNVEAKNKAAAERAEARALAERLDEAVRANPEKHPTILDIEPKQCRYPVTGVGIQTRFCGERQREGSSYCPAHHAACMTPIDAARRAKTTGRPDYLARQLNGRSHQ